VCRYSCLVVLKYNKEPAIKDKDVSNSLLCIMYLNCRDLGALGRQTRSDVDRRKQLV
jgi:hypothetical protein